MASPLISSPVTNTDKARIRKKKTNQTIREETRNSNNKESTIEWKSEAQQQVYSSKLLQALRHVRLNASPSGTRKGRAVREAADRALAVTAKGRTRWSRAILRNRLTLKFMKNKRRRLVTPGNRQLPKKPGVSILRLKTKNLLAVQKKGRVLGRLVPGCRKEPLPVILEEATDYIAALEMQVRAMTVIAEVLSGTASTDHQLNQPASSRSSPT